MRSAKFGTVSIKLVAGRLEEADRVGGGEIEARRHRLGRRIDHGDLAGPARLEAGVEQRARDQHVAVRGVRALAVGLAVDVEGGEIDHARRAAVDEIEHEHAGRAERRHERLVAGDRDVLRVGARARRQREHDLERERMEEHDRGVAVAVDDREVPAGEARHRIAAHRAGHGVDRHVPGRELERARNARVVEVARRHQRERPREARVGHVVRLIVRHDRRVDGTGASVALGACLQPPSPPRDAPQIAATIVRIIDTVVSSPIVVHAPSAADLELAFYERFLLRRASSRIPVQEQAIGPIFAGKSVMVTVPTGTGKTLMAKAALFARCNEARRAIYTTPLRALTEEKFRELCDGLRRGATSGSRPATTRSTARRRSRSRSPRSCGTGSSPIEQVIAGRRRRDGRGPLLQRPRARLRVGAVDHRARSAHAARDPVGHRRARRQVLPMGRADAARADAAGRVARSQDPARPRVPRGDADRHGAASSPSTATCRRSCSCSAASSASRSRGS